MTDASNAMNERALSTESSDALPEALSAEHQDHRARQILENIPRTNRKFDTFIFDLDGTLLDTLPDLVLMTNGILEELGCPTHTQEEVLSYVGNGVRKLMKQALPPNVDAETEAKAMELWNGRFLEYYHHTVPFEGIMETLEALKAKGCKLGVVSNKFQAGVDVVMDLCLPGMIEVTYGESPDIPRKPDPTGILVAMADLDATPEKTVYVGDSPGDVRAAHNAGVFAVAVSWGYRPLRDFLEGSSRPDMLIDAPKDLLTLAN